MKLSHFVAFLTLYLRWMGTWPVMTTVGGKHLSNLLARLIFVWSSAIGASDNYTLFSRNVEIPTDTFRAIWNANLGRTSPYQQWLPLRDFWLQSREGSVAGKEVIKTLSQPYIKSAWPSPGLDSSIKKNSLLNHVAKPPPIWENLIFQKRGSIKL